MIKEVQVKILPNQIEQEAVIQVKLMQLLQIAQAELSGYRIIRRSIDARQRQVFYVLTILAFINEPTAAATPTLFDYKNVANATEVVIIGAGPAGLFAALKLIELGIKPIIFERGKSVQERRRDLAALNRLGIVNPESNYCFGEGGAGTYSDGKLYTRSTKRGNVTRILDLFIQHGASESIRIDTHPHIGTNKLPSIIANMRQTILDFGGEIHFGKKLTDLKMGTNGSVHLSINEHENWNVKAVLLATGHSARDVFELLAKRNIALEAKPFALGVRIEHPQAIIDAQQYHCTTRSAHLPAASYSLVEQINNRGVFSFCMCPGGIIAPASTAPGEIVVNGWSPSKRNNPFANSGMVVQITAEDLSKFEKANPGTPASLVAMKLQQQVEQLSFQAGGGNLKAPAQRLVDFVQKKHSTSLPLCSYHPGLTSTQLAEVLPDFINDALVKGLTQFGKKMNGYYTNEAVLVATESRTSSPVRIPRDAVSLQHPEVKGLFPCGEGAGYAGGIVSAAIDGEKCAEAIAKYLNLNNAS